MKKFVRSKKAISPVIATVILVAVTIVVAVSVSYWMGGIAGVYTRFEKVEISSCYAVKIGGYYSITVQLRNSGSQDASLQHVLLNGRPTEDYSFSIAVKWEVGEDSGLLNETLMTIPVGSSGKIYIWFSDTGTFDSGTTLDLKFHTTAGKDYPQMLALP